MLGPVLDLALELENHVLDLLHCSFKGAQSDLHLLMLAKGFKLLVHQLVLHLFKLVGKGKLLVSEVLKGTDLAIECGAILGRAGVLADLGQEGTSEDNLVIRGDAGQVVVLGHLHGEGIGLNQHELPKDFRDQSSEAGVCSLFQ